jgi:uncharacterized protein (TIGR03437 family)
VTSKGVAQAFNRSIALSRNGRYAVLFNGIDASGAILPPTLIDRVSGAQYSVPSSPYPYSTDVAGNQQIITSTGELLLKQLLSTGDVQLSLWSPTGEHDFDFPPSRSLRLVRVSDDAKRIVWADSTTLHVIDVATGQDRMIATFPVPSIRNFGIDNAGDLVAAVADPSAGVPPQLYLVPIDGSGPKAIAPREHGYREAAISGDGRLVFGATLDGALVSIDTSTGQISEIVTAPPTVDTITGGNASNVNPTIDLVPGSQYRITGSSLNDSISLGGIALPVLLASANEIRFQVPFEATLGSSSLHFTSASPFEQSIPVQVQATAPVLLAMVKRDFSGLATNVSPGDIVNFYMVGLGTVSPPVATGVPAPVNPAAVVVSGISAVLGVGVFVNQHGPTLPFNVPVLFAGLAPGMIGIYQVTVEMPETSGVEPGQHSVALRFQIGSESAYAHFTLTTK